MQTIDKLSDTQKTIEEEPEAAMTTSATVGSRIDAQGFEVKTSLLWWQKRGLSYTASGYGRKMPTDKMIKVGNRWYRIYCTIFSNCGTLYICRKGKEITVYNVQ